MKKWLIVLFITLSSYEWFASKEERGPFGPFLETSVDNHLNNTLEEVHKNKRSGIQVSGTGTVIKLLKDDRKGSKHQKFILRISPEQTILIAHNIDLAPRINTLSNGDLVAFNGEYEWTDEGGIIHWTHHSPRGNHARGWLKHDGITYQ